MKRFLFLMVLFCMGILSGFAQSNEFTYTDDNGVTWGGRIEYEYDSENYIYTQNVKNVCITSTSCNSEEEVVVPGEISYEGVKYKVTSLEGVFSDNKIVEKVTIPKSVTSLNSTFNGCSALSEVVNTSQLKYVNFAFKNCSSIKSIDLSSCETVESGSFGGCSQLENVVLKSCKEIGYAAFYDYENRCRKLKSVGDISHCESIGEYAFYGCSSLTSVDLSSCKTIGNNSFRDCSALESVGNTKLLTDIPEAAFNGCSNLQNIDLSNCTSIGSSAFSGCFKIKHLNLNKCTYISDRAFSLNYGLEKIDLSAIKTIEEYAFSNCSSLTEVTGLKLIKSLPNGAFSDCNKLASIDLSKIESLGLDCMSGTAVESVELPNLKKWGVRVFKDCKKLTSVTFPESINSIPTMAFWNCEKLSTIDLSHCTLIGGGAFYNCTSLTDIDLLNVKQIEYTTYSENYQSFEGGSFMNCNKLTSVTLDSCQNLGNMAFYGCTSLKKVTIGCCQNFGERVFYGCTSLKEVTLGSCQNVGDLAFGRCTSLEKITLPETVTNLGGSAFSGCTSLKEVNLGSCQNLGAYAFDGCTSLEKITLPKTVTNLGSGAFEYCTSLKEVTLDSCQTLGDKVFYGCTSLAKITLPETVTNLGWACFDGSTIVTSMATVPPVISQYGNMEANTPVMGEYVMVNVPKESLSSYKSANCWKDMAKRIFPIGSKFDYDVTTVAQPSTSDLLDKVGKNNSNSVVSLKVKGSINSYDIMVIRNKMDNLHYLDLSDANVVENSYEYYTGCSTKNDTIGRNAFRDLSKLITVSLPNSVKVIESGALYNCTKLKRVVLPEKLLSIKGGWDDGAFACCSSLTDVKFKACNYIGGHAFYSCNALNHITLPSDLKAIDQYAFASCNNLHSVDFPPMLERIGSYAFENCALDSISLPGLTRINEYAFQNCSNLKEVKVPSTLVSVGDKAFEGCTQLNDVFTYTILPVKINQNTFCTYETATLHVPVQSYDNYYWDTEWSQFHAFEDFNEPYKYFYLNKEYILASRIDGCPNIDIRDNGGLIVKGDAIQNAGDIHVSGSGTIIANGNVDASKFHIDIDVTSNYWYFLSFPFDVKLSDIAAPGQFVFRKYDGATRASQGAGGWKDLDATDKWLHRGTGYIFQSAESGKLTLPVVKEKFGKLEAEDVQETLGTFASSNEQNASWNFVGNPHTSYFDMDDLGYNAPITYWNGMSYEAVRPGDDNYVFKPFQAFFVQKPQNVNEMEFGAEFRLTQTGSQKRSSDNKAKRLAKGIDINRQMVNLTLSDGTHTDKTRVVFNEDKTQRYELDCDAAKFESSTSVPQLYTLEANNVKYAINERPLGSVSLGFEVQKAGDYTISAIRMDSPMLLKDNLTDATVDLSTSDYHFTSETGTFNGRFTLMPNKSTTGIAEFAKNTGVSIIPTEGGINFSGVEGKHVSIYSLNGIEIGSTQSSGTINLGQGIYVVKMDNTSTKVMVK